MAKDLLDDIFDTLSLKGVLYFQTNFAPPWGVQVPQYSNVARFHLLIRGNCYIQMPSGEAIDMEPGDLIIIPHGLPHVMASSATQKTFPLETIVEETGYDGESVFTIGQPTENSRNTHMLCGHFNFRETANHPIINALPDFLYVCNIKRARYPLLDDLLRLITQRVCTEELGANSTISRLSEIVFIEMLRSGISVSPEVSRVLEAFKDSRLSRALQLIHNQPNKPWSVASLAKEAAMSRSRFAKHFHELTHSSPMAYLTEWRLQKSYSLLERSHASIQEIAQQCGYLSPAAFSRAFTNRFQCAPSSIRRQKTD